MYYSHFFILIPCRLRIRASSGETAWFHVGIPDLKVKYQHPYSRLTRIDNVIYVLADEYLSGFTRVLDGNGVSVTACVILYLLWHRTGGLASRSRRSSQDFSRTEPCLQVHVNGSMAETTVIVNSDYTVDLGNPECLLIQFVLLMELRHSWLWVELCHAALSPWAW